MFDLPIVYHPIYDLFSDQESRFPTGKYQELRSVLEVSKILSKKNLFVPRRVEFDTISLTHDQSYVSRVLNCSLSAKEKREIGLSNIDHFSERAVFSAGGTLLAAELALNFGVAANAAGGSHHANFSKGSGFCIFNDVAIAVNCLLKNGKVKNVLILDLDVHQGDGTAELFESDSRVFTVSVHCQKNFPVKILDKKENWRKIIDIKKNGGWIHWSQLKKINSFITTNEKILFLKPSLFSKPIAKIQEGRLLLVDRCITNWCKIKTEEYSGWINSANLWGKIP